MSSQRKCCVCHEFAARSINVHHIVQEADRGPNTLDNAIVLCLRCHAEAGHFNARHPMGTKYSPSELRRHRDIWWALVEKGQIQSASCAVHVHRKRKSISSDLHTYLLVAELQNGTESIDKWKLHIALPAVVPTRTQDMDRLQELKRDGIKYSLFEATGGGVFPGENEELVGTGLTQLEYDVNDALFHHPQQDQFLVTWHFYSSASPPLQEDIPWSEMHEY